MSGFFANLFSGSGDKKQTIKYVRNNVQKQGELVDYAKIQNEAVEFTLNFVSPLEPQNMQKKQDLHANNKLMQVQNSVIGYTNNKYQKNSVYKNTQKSGKIFVLQPHSRKKSFNEKDYLLKQSQCYDINLHQEQQQNYRHNRKEKLYQRQFGHSIFNRKYDRQNGHDYADHKENDGYNEKLDNKPNNFESAILSGFTKFWKNAQKNNNEEKKFGVSRYQKQKLAQTEKFKNQESSAKFAKKQSIIEPEKKQTKKDQTQKQSAELNNHDRSREHRSSVKRQPIFLNRRRSLNKKINNQDFDISRYKDGYNDGYKDALNKINNKTMNNSFHNSFYRNETNPPLINWNKSTDMYVNHSGRTMVPTINIAPAYYRQNVIGYPQRVPVQPLYGQQALNLPLHRVVYESRFDESRLTSNTKIESNLNNSVSQGENIQRKTIDFQYKPKQQIMPPGELVVLIKKAREANYRKKVY